MSWQRVLFAQAGTEIDLKEIFAVRMRPLDWIMGVGWFVSWLFWEQFENSANSLGESLVGHRLSSFHSEKLMILARRNELFG